MEISRRVHKKLENFASFGKLEIGVVDNFDLQIETADKALKLAQDTYDIKLKQIDKEFELELKKLEVFKMAASVETGERARIEKRIEDIKALKAENKQNRITKTREENDAKTTKRLALQGAGTTGTLGDRATVVGKALATEDEDADLTIAKLTAVQNAMQPMVDSLKALRPRRRSRRQQHLQE